MVIINITVLKIRTKIAKKENILDIYNEKGRGGEWENGRKTLYAQLSPSPPLPISPSPLPFHPAIEVTYKSNIFTFDSDNETMRKLVILTGAGMSSESGIRTFRDSGGLWEEYNVTEVATYDAWLRNRELVLRFYNERRRQLEGCIPNAGHTGLVTA